MFGERLKFILEDKNITQIELSKYLNLTQQAVNRWCQNITQPDIPTIIKIADCLNVSTDFLLGNDVKISKEEEELKEKLLLKKALVKAGYMNDDEDLTDEELERLMKFVITNKDFIKKY